MGGVALSSHCFISFGFCSLKLGFWAGWGGCSCVGWSGSPAGGLGAGCGRNLGVGWSIWPDDDSWAW